MLQLLSLPPFLSPEPKLPARPGRQDWKNIPVSDAHGHKPIISYVKVKYLPQAGLSVSTSPYRLCWSSAAILFVSLAPSSSKGTQLVHFDVIVLFHLLDGTCQSQLLNSSGVNFKLFQFCSVFWAFFRFKTKLKLELRSGAQEQNKLSHERVPCRNGIIIVRHRFGSWKFITP